MADLIEKQDSFNRGRKKINDSITHSNDAISKSSKALTNSKNTQQQLDNIVIEGDSSVEAAQARVNADGDEFDTLRDRLNFNDEKRADTNVRLDDVSDKVPQFFGNISLQPHPLASNPALTADDVTDLNNVRFVADPFFILVDDVYHMFMEVADEDDFGSIGHATSVDGIDWEYNKLIISDDIHCSYPFVIEYEGEYLMVIERGGRSTEGIEMWRATNFPEEWEFDRMLIEDGSHVDATPFYHDGYWYMLTYDDYTEQSNLYWANDLKSTNWTSHPSNPVIEGEHVRGGGRPIKNGKFYDLFIQDGSDGIYGRKLFIYRITKLSTTEFEYKVIEEPVLKAQNNDMWNSYGMHHADLMMVNKGSLPIALVDGRGLNSPWSIRTYTIGGERPKPYLRATNDNEQAVPNEEWTVIDYNNVYNDTEETYSGGEYVVGEDGLYHISLSVAFQFTDDDVNRNNFLTNLRLKRNGDEIMSSPRAESANSTNLRRALTYSYTYPLYKGDVLTVEVYQASNSELQLSPTGENVWFNLIKID